MYHLQFMVTCDVTDEASCALGTEVITRHLEGKQLIPKVRQRQSWWGWWYPETSTLGWQVSRGTKTHCQESHNLSRQQASYTTWREWQGIFKPAYKTCGYKIFLCQRNGQGLAHERNCGLFLRQTLSGGLFHTMIPSWLSPLEIAMGHQVMKAYLRSLPMFASKVPEVCWMLTWKQTYRTNWMVTRWIAKLKKNTFKGLNKQ